MKGSDQSQSEAPSGVFKSRELKVAGNAHRRVNYRQQTLSGKEHPIRQLSSHHGEAKPTFQLRVY